MYLHGLRGWRQLNGRLGLRMAVNRRSGPLGAGLAYAYRLYAPSVCDMNSILEIVSGRYAIQIYLLTYVLCVMCCRQQNEEFQYTVSRLEVASECQLLPLSSFLTLPMQRITRMPLLVGAVCQRLETTDGHSCPRDITRCLSILQKVTCLFIVCHCHHHRRRYHHHHHHDN